jgi:hypothetical protein
MTLAARKLFVALPALGMVALVAVVGCTPPVDVTVPAYHAPARTPAAELKNAPVGISGCLAAACHGGPGADVLAGKLSGTAWQGSGSCWVAADPHTAAYSLLTDRPHRAVRVTAKHIMDLYAPGTEAVDDARCVACHTNPTLAGPKWYADPHAQSLRTEGVSCEACHGSAGGWVSEHTAWRGPRDAVYADSGMVRLYDLGERALNCAGCHVGAPADPARGIPVRDMNHDMIAAGHPRLAFDFAEYLRRLPTHWQEKDRTTSPPTPRPVDPAKAWLVGRAAHAEAACRLLADRAERSKTDERTPWPELAEYNCAACHHDLLPADEEGNHWRHTPEYLGERPPGLLPWQMVWPITPAAGIAAPARAESKLAAVLALMEAARRPDPALAERAAKAGADRLRAEVRDLVGLPDADAGKRLKQVLPAQAPQPAEWDSARQLFLGAAALERSLRTAPRDVPTEFRQALDAFRTENWAAVVENLNRIREIQNSRP